MRSSVNAYVVVLGLCAASSLTRAQSVILDSAQSARLAMLGRVWGTAKYFHPAFLSRDIAWDSALVVAVPRVMTARNASEYGAAVDNMLRVLDDPNTRVHPRGVPQLENTSGPLDVTSHWEDDSTLVVSIPRFSNGFSQKLQHALPSIRAARRIVFDMRGPAPTEGEADDVFGDGLDAILAGRSIRGPTVHRRVQRRYDEPFETIERAGELFHPATNTFVRQVVFVTFADSDLPAIAWALEAAGQGAIVLDSARGTNLKLYSSRSSVYSMEIGEGLIADIRLSDIVGRVNGVVAPDVISARAGMKDEPLRLALELARRPTTARALVANTNLGFIPKPEATYSTTRYPTLPYRLLAGFRYWNVVHYYYPSEMPAGEDWSRALVDVTRMMAQAGDSAEYAVGVWSMARRLSDIHASAQSASIANLRGASWPAAAVEYVEGQPVIVRMGRDSTLRASGLRVGDIVLKVDGEDMRARKARLEKYSGGTRPDVIELHYAANSALSGPEGSTARITVRSANGIVREVSLLRRGRPCVSVECLRRSDSAYRLLPGNVGYVDLSLLEEPMVDSMFETFKHTSAIVFDGRGYPRSTGPAITPRLTDHFGVAIAGRRDRAWFTPDSTTRTVTTALVFSNPSANWRYQGRTVALIDYHAQSQGEGILIALASLGATLIGSPTAGGIGASTSVALPGGFTASFPTGDWGWPDGRSITRVGIQPNVLARPTIAGIRAGRDEVLERALSFLKNGKAK